MSGNRFLKELDQRLWKNDITMYWKWKKLYEKANTDWGRDIAMRNMERIQKRWPDHPME